MLSPEVLAGIRRGIEKESLRVRPDGRLATTPHPAGLGASLTHPNITTDFSESQLELITGVHTSVEACLEELTAIHQVVHRHIGDETLWCASMPCGLPPDDDIPIGQYGSSNLGRAKTVYRQGLAHRYGKRMQTICGIHYNFSLPESAWPLLHRAAEKDLPANARQTDAYFYLIRNFRRHSWLLLYLLGASPTVCRSFAAGRDHGLQELAGGTLYLPGATSLRMGPLGYQSAAQTALAVSFNSLRSYASALNDALNKPYPPYEAIGLRNDGGYRQLATSLLQIENEFYGTIRPKPRFRSGERPLYALGERGVEYVEVRLIDNDPFYPIGIRAATIRLLDIFLLHCVLGESPPDTPGEIAEISRNQLRVAQRGRDGDLRLERRGKEIALADWGGEILGQCEAIAGALDEAHGGNAYRTALSDAVSSLANPAATRSARILEEMDRNYKKSYVAFALEHSQQHRRTLLELPLAAETAARFAHMAEDSLAAKQNIESEDSVPFETYRRQYLSKDLLSGALLQSNA